MRTPTLTNDQRKAAEAAFRKLPFNPAWSEGAWEVYDGISAALRKIDLERGEPTPASDEAAELVVCGETR
jgi:hypothetical protein